MTTTTHLVCAPEELEGRVQLESWLVLPGESVHVDAAIARFIDERGIVQLVRAPLSGILGPYCMRVGDWFGALDLLAMLEAEEPDLGMGLIDQVDANDNMSLAACRQIDIFPTESLPVISHSIDRLSAALGLSPDDLSRRGVTLNEADVLRHVREELRTLDAIRALLKR